MVDFTGFFVNNCESELLQFPHYVCIAPPHTKIFLFKTKNQMKSSFTKKVKVNSSKIPTYSHGQELFYKFVSNFTNKLVKQLLSMTVFMVQVGFTGSDELIRTLLNNYRNYV